MTSFPYHESRPIFTDVELGQTGRTEIYNKNVESIISGVYLVNGRTKSVVELKIITDTGKGTIERTDKGEDLQFRETFFVGETGRLVIEVTEPEDEALTDTAVVFATQ